MKPTSKTLSWAFVIILLAVGIFTGLGVILMHKQPLVLQGQAEATEIRISGKLPGRIDTFFVQEGDWVHQGDTLVVINSPEVHAKYQQVNALEQVAVQQNKKIDAGTRRQIVATALQLWNKTKSDLTLAQTTYNRILTLYKDSVITSQRKDEVEAMYKAAVAAERAAYERIIIPVTEYDRISFVGKCHQIISSKVTTGIPVASIVVIPSLACHLYGDKQAKQHK